MKKLLLIALAISSQSMAKHLNTEKYYQKIHCDAVRGKTEVLIHKNRRVDCLTAKYAIEHDFASKAYECTGQANYYAEITNKIPVCALIFESESDNKYLDIVTTLQKGQQDLQLVKLYRTPNGVRCESKNKELCGSL